MILTIDPAVKFGCGELLGDYSVASFHSETAFLVEKVDREDGKPVVVIDTGSGYASYCYLLPETELTVRCISVTGILVDEAIRIRYTDGHELIVYRSDAHYAFFKAQLIGLFPHMSHYFEEGVQ